MVKCGKLGRLILEIRVIKLKPFATTDGSDFMSDLLIWSLKNARRQTLSLVEDLRDEQMCRQSAAGENPPAWILGHLLLGDTYLLSMLKVRELSADFADLLRKYGPNSIKKSRLETVSRRKIDRNQLAQTRRSSTNEKFRPADTGRNACQNAADHWTSSANARFPRRTSLRSNRRLAQSAKTFGGKRNFCVLVI